MLISSSIVILAIPSLVCAQHVTDINNMPNTTSDPELRVFIFSPPSTFNTVVFSGCRMNRATSMHRAERRRFCRSAGIPAACTVVLVVSLSHRQTARTVRSVSYPDILLRTESRRSSRLVRQLPVFVRLRAAYSRPTAWPENVPIAHSYLPPGSEFAHYQLFTRRCPTRAPTRSCDCPFSRTSGRKRERTAWRVVRSFDRPACAEHDAHQCVPSFHSYLARFVQYVTESGRDCQYDRERRR